MHPSQPSASARAHHLLLARDPPRLRHCSLAADSAGWAGREAGNGKPFLKTPQFLVLEEGEQYKGAWLETQPMAGAMYAARNVRYALNNQLVFIRSQREDGRYPHRVDPCAGKKNVHPADPVCATLHPAWSTYLQGLFMASPAADVAWFMKLQPGNQADKYLTELKASLEAYDGYLVSMLPAACCRVGSAAC